MDRILVHYVRAMHMYLIRHEPTGEVRDVVYCKKQDAPALVGAFWGFFEFPKALKIR